MSDLYGLNEGGVLLQEKTSLHQRVLSAHLPAAGGGGQVLLRLGVPFRVSYGCQAARSGIYPLIFFFELTVA